MVSAYWNPTRRIIANGSLSQLPELAASFEPKKILLVLGKQSFRKSPQYAGLRQGLSKFAVEEAPPIEHNPTLAFAEELGRSFRNQKHDLVIGIGGGSVLDCAKTLRILLTQREEHLNNFWEGESRFERPGLPYIAVPTTAGTGSEVTPYASFQTPDHQKISLVHRWLFPDVALIDPVLTHSMPPYVAACSGLDALSQAVESFWSIHHTPFSETHSLRAITLILENFLTVLKDPTHCTARENMSVASTESGLAITQTRTTAVHAVSYPLTTLFGVPHGHACALTLASFIRYNGPALDPDHASRLWKALGGSSPEEAARVVEQLMEKAGLERSLRKLGLNARDIDAIIESGFRSDRVTNNPRKVTPETLRAVLQGIY